MLLFLELFVLQLVVYGSLIWFLWIIISFLLSRYGGVLGIFFGHIIVAIMIAYLDVSWIQSEMSQPGWDGAPDMDIIFYIGMVIRILAVNTWLLIVSTLGLSFRLQTTDSNGFREEN